MISSGVDDRAHNFIVYVDLCHCLEEQLEILKNLTVVVGGKMYTMWLCHGLIGILCCM